MRPLENISVPRDLWEEILDYLDSRNDIVDGPDGQPQPNGAMRILNDIKRAGLPALDTPAPLPAHSKIVMDHSWMRPNGFTLIELMIVVVVVGVLAAIAIPNFISMQDRAKEAVVKVNMHTLQLDTESYMTLNDGMYPTNAGSVAAGDRNPGQIAVTKELEMFRNPFTRRGGPGISWENRASMAADPGPVPGIVSYADSSRQVYSIKGRGKVNPLRLVLMGGDISMAGN